MSYDEAWDQSSSITEEMDDLEDPHCQSTLYFTSFNMQSLHAPNFQKLANIWEARAPARTASGSKSKPTTWPILRSACEDTQWSGWKRNNAGTAGSCSVSPLTSVEMRTENPRSMSLWPPWPEGQSCRLLFLVFRDPTPLSIFHNANSRQSLLANPSNIGQVQKALEGRSINLWDSDLKAYPSNIGQVQRALEGQSTDLWDSE